MLLYVSWGGTGRVATVQEAMRRAVDGAADDPDRDPGLRYLAVLDDDHFDDLDAVTLDIVTQELEWLLESQLELTRRQVGAEDLAVEVVVRQGDVTEAVVDVLGELGGREVLIGAPVPAGADAGSDGLLEKLRARVTTPVTLIEAS